MDKTQKQEKTIVNREIEKSKALMEKIMEQKRAGKIDIKSTFELMYVNFLPLLDDRKKVEDDLKELKDMLDSVSNRMLAIIEKSKNKKNK